MKTRIVLLSLIALISILTSCKKDNLGIIPSNSITTAEKSIAGNNKLQVSSLFQVHITFSDTEESLIVEANENLHQYIQVEDKNGWLKIDLRDNLSIIGANTVLNIYLTTKKITEYQVQGAASVILENELYANNIDIDLSGACHFTGSLNANNLYAELSGASSIEVEGSSSILDVKADGASTMKTYGFETTQLEADLNGASQIYLSVIERLSVKANGASTVFYKGNGIIHNQDLNGGSRIIKMD